MLLKKLDIGVIKKRFFLTLITILLALVLIEIWTVNVLATYGEKINQLEQTKSTYMMENQLLENEISKEASLLNIKQSSLQLGFQKIGTPKYLQLSGLALNR